MSSDIQTALVVLLVGMITVFVILALVVLTGQLLIRIVNQFFADAASPKASGSIADQTAATPLSGSAGISKAKLSAIIAAVDIITEGKGKVKDIRTK